MTVYKAPFECPECNAPLHIERVVEATQLVFVDEETGKITPEDHLEGCPAEGRTVIRETLKCDWCEKVFNYLTDKDGNIVSFNDDVF